MYSSARAVGQGDWDKVIQLEKASLVDDPANQHAHSMMGFAQKRKGELDKAKACYAEALAIDSQCVAAVEALAEIYATEGNHGVAYTYVLKGLYSVEEIDYRVPSFIKLGVSLVLKILKPSVPFKKIHAQTKQLDQSRHQWKAWAEKYKCWYEKNHHDAEKQNVH